MVSNALLYCIALLCFTLLCRARQTADREERSGNGTADREERSGNGAPRTAKSAAATAHRGRRRSQRHLKLAVPSLGFFT